MRFAAAIVWAMAWGLFGLPWDGSVDSFNLRRSFWTFYPLTDHQLVDVVLNVMFYVPLGAILPSLGPTLLQTLGVGALLSVTTEALQMFSPTRYANLADIVLNTAGVALGIALSVLFKKRDNG